MEVMSQEPRHTGMTDMTDREYTQTKEHTIVSRQDCEDRGKRTDKVAGRVTVGLQKLGAPP